MTVTIVKPECERFRVPFYVRLGDLLSERGIVLRVLFGVPRHSGPELVSTAFRYGIVIPSLSVRFGRRQVTWQHLPWSLLRLSDLVIVQQGNGNLLNYGLLVARIILPFRLAFWGHGRNFQASKDSLFERVKRCYSRMADHWFAYNQVAADAIIESGVSASSVTCVNNTIDIETESTLYNSLSDADDSSLRTSIHLPSDSNTAIYCGRLYAAKCIPFLLRCVAALRRRNPKFHFIMIGGGPLSGLVAEFASHNGVWFHYVGPKFGVDKVRYFRLATLQLVPGVVGLSIVDSMALDTPLVTTDVRGHGPEIGYLRSGVNGVMTRHIEEEYCSAVLTLFKSSRDLDRLLEGCRTIRAELTIENMARRFSEGVLRITEDIEQNERATRHGDNSSTQ